MKSLTVFSLLLSFSLTGFSAPWDAAISTIQKVGPEGKGNAEAARAHAELTAQSSDVILPILTAMKDTGPIADNWMRSAAEIVFEQAKEKKTDLPGADLKKFVRNTENAPRARELAFELYEKVDAKDAASLVPGFSSDPNNALRRRAVTLLIDQGKKLTTDGGKEEAATEVMIEALGAARDIDQIKSIAEHLQKELNREVDLPTHFGFLMRWHLLAPFTNIDRAGFDEAFPPEKEVDLKASHSGKDGDIKWQEFASSDDYGMIDFNKPYSPLKEVTGFAYTEFNSGEARKAEIRLGCKNAWKVWLNGKLIFGRDEYHRGMRIDQYILPVDLEKGKNTILIKACQDAQEQDWTVQWEFQMRICDETGTAILSTDRLSTPKAEVKTGRRSGKGE